MSERLFIRLGQTAEQPCSWLVWSEQEQEIIGSGELSNAGALSTLTERAGNRGVDVLVPASSITLTEVDLPEKSQRQAIKALPFMLEENLAQNVDELHFVTGPRNGDALSIAVVAHEQMQTWIEWLSDAGLKAKCIVPDCLALPLVDCDWAAMNLGEEILLRTGAGSGVSLSQTWLDMALPQLLTADAQTTVAGYTELQLSGAEIKPQPLDLPMLVLAKGLLNAPMNLLSGIYKPKKEYGKHLLLWRNAAIAFAVVIILALVNKGLNIHQMNRAAAELQAQSEQIYKQVVPGSSRVVNLRSQMGSYVRTLQGGGSGSEFFVMLSGMQDAFAQVPALKPTTLRFDSARNEIRMQVTAKNYEQIEKFKELIAGSYQLTGGAMNSGESEVTSTLTIRSK
ncbi:type II secretion system protein GspL [Shewanella fidelis]|uniref:Type II secretion system protein L n=1 Tax=Shewanella fidelis TaxID=173509 RepID=A0AAW8NT94_9GAMM|nr:type II secretion system protein GspL [Shewanella fidelis]MDR8526000.1 type II secretion system protein GspL [Shewanella fidelis]MDW4813812.1 type II secretion system protein GspL [Shewanella fidelis]MDW4817996.1 type II secretion system protein GspL [Shewanella fidelis]MDW4822063.1 type II secretion system protein GspL [Shewanella fidelis]MDW4826228.1 type II secretion system protein GspL [Shewanella fidelis]